MMTNVTKRLLLLLAILLLGLGSVLLLPKNVERLSPGITLKLPDFVGNWYGQEQEVGEAEKIILGSETQFARKLYTNGRGDTVLVSIVLSGEDMSSSIHRPERCLPSQGYKTQSSHPIQIGVQSHPLTVMRLYNLRDSSLPDRPLPMLAGKPVSEFSLLYYWFIGSETTTADHNTRYLMDMRDRILKGSYQPWAYVTIKSNITSNYRTFGRNEKQTDAMMQDFVGKLVPMILKPNVKTQ